MKKRTTKTKNLNLEGKKDTFELLVIFPPGRPLPEPEFNDDGGEHQDDGLRGHLGVPPPALPPALHHLLEVRHHALAPAGGLVGTGIRDPLLFRLSPSLPLCSWCLWVRLKISFSR